MSAMEQSVETYIYMRELLTGYDAVKSRMASVCSEPISTVRSNSKVSSYVTRC